MPRSARLRAGTLRYLACRPSNGARKISGRAQVASRTERNGEGARLDVCLSGFVCQLRPVRTERNEARGRVDLHQNGLFLLVELTLWHEKCGEKCGGNEVYGRNKFIEIIPIGFWFDTSPATIFPFRNGASRAPADWAGLGLGILKEISRQRGAHWGGQQRASAPANGYEVSCCDAFSEIGDFLLERRKLETMDDLRLSL